MRGRAGLLVCGAAGLALAAPAPAGAPRTAASRPPVVLIVFDELPTTSLLGRGGRIDAVRYPAFASLAREATWFPYATTVHDNSHGAVPAIFDGKRPKTDRPATPAGHPDSIFTFFHRRLGYRVRGAEEATRVCPVRLCGRRRSTRFYLNRSRNTRFLRFARAIRPTRRPTLYVKHTLLPHVPWVYLPSGKRYLKTSHAPVRGLASERGAHDLGLQRQAYQRHLLQVGATDALLGVLLDRLRRTGLYDRALIVVTADHGVSIRRFERDRRTVRPHNFHAIAPVPLLIKRPRQRRGRIDRSLARTSDILPTIAAVLGRRVPWRTSGRSVFSRRVKRRRRAATMSRDHDRVVRIGRAALRRRMRGALRGKLWLFGYGHRLGTLGGTPHRRLVGRPLSGLTVRRPGRVRVRIADRGELRSVKPGANFVPSFVMGRIRGGRRGARRAYALAVNGYVWATGRTFHFRGSSRETFAALVPEFVLVPGRNSVRVIAIGRRRGRLVLRDLGGV